MAAADRAVDPLLRRQHGALARRQAVAAGFTTAMIRARVRSGAWTAHRLRSIYLDAGHAASWDQELWAAHLWGGPLSMLGGRAAAAIYGLERCAPGPVDLLMPRGAKHGAPGVTVMRRPPLAKPRRRRPDGLPYADPITTLLGVASLCPADLIDDAMESAFDLGLTTPARLHAALGGQTGAKALRALLDGRQPGRPRQRRLEGELCRLVRRRLQRELRRQHPVDIGPHRYYLDFALPDLRVAIELDGFAKLRGRGGKQRFLTRDTALQASGWVVLHFSWDDVMLRPDYVVATIAQAMRRAG